MSNIFNIRRAGKYLVHDLTNAKNNFLYSMLILGFLPIVVFILMQLMSLVFEGKFSEMSEGMQVVMSVIAITVLVISFPIKQYGALTEKRYGSDWLMLPASTFEKWVSMIVVCCVVLPAVFFTLFFFSDWLLSAIFPKLYPEAMISSGVAGRLMNGFKMSIAEDAGVKFNFIGVGYANWCENILIITLGAIVFKKAKFPKTLFAFMGLCMLVVFIVTMFNGFSIDESDIENWLGSDDVEVFSRRLNAFMTVIYTIMFVLLGGGLYLRLKTIKH